MAEAVRAFEAALRRHRVVRVGLRGGEGAAVGQGGGAFGVPVAVSSEVGVVEFLRDFRRDGWSAFPMGRVEEVRSSAFERAYTRLCAAEGVLAKVRGVGRIEVGSMVEVLASLRRRGKVVLVNHELPGGDVATTLGVLTGVGQEELEIKPFDATGRWAPRGRVGMGEVIDVQWGSRYLGVWGRGLGAG